MQILKHSFFLFWLLALSACSSFKQQQDRHSLDAKIKNTRIVLVGETHTDYGHHLNQLEVIKKSAKKWGGVLTIGLEMVQQPFQAYLDDYIAGNISENEMLRGVEWYDRWRYNFRLYRPIFAYAKQHNIPLIALNIPQDLTKRISKVGISGLTPKQRQQLPKMIDRSKPEYTARLNKVFRQHAHGKQFNQQTFNKFVDAQLAWDEGMAFAASRYLTANPNKRMVILAGSGHLINREGIPSRLDRQLKLATEQRSLVVLSHSEKKYSNRETDFSLPTKEMTLPPAGLIGIGMKDTKRGVKISSLAKSGAAIKAGIQKGDFLLALNQTRVKKASDVRLWLLDKKPKQKVTALIRRNKQHFSKSFTLGSSLKK